MEKPPLISIIVPVYYGEKSLHPLTERIFKSIEKIDLAPELIFVNDGSPDSSWQIIRSLAQQYPEIKGVNLSRNFGQHNAIIAGLAESKGEYVVVMDCDLQDIPEEIPNLYKKLLEGYDAVLAQRLVRSDTYLKKLTSSLFFKVLSYLTETNQDGSVGNFGIYRRKVIQAVLSLHDKVKIFPLMIKWVGFKTTKIEVNHGSRLYGKSSYSFSKLFTLAFDVMISFSNKPLKMTVKFGLIISLFSFVVGSIYFLKYFLGLIHVSGYTSLIISIWFLSGVIIFSTGILGLYIGKIFENTKNRPTYIITERYNI